MAAIPKKRINFYFCVGKIETDIDDSDVIFLTDAGDFFFSFFLYIHIVMKHSKFNELLNLRTSLKLKG